MSPSGGSFGARIWAKTLLPGCCRYPAVQTAGGPPLVAVQSVRRAT